METTERADQLVDIIGDLLAMAQDAVDNGELVLASHLQKGADAALMRLAATDRELAGAWGSIYRGNVADREVVAEQLLCFSGSRHFTSAAQAVFSMAIEMVLRGRPRPVAACVPVAASSAGDGIRPERPDH